MDHGVYYCLVALVPLVYFLLKSLWKKAPFGSGSRHGLELRPGPWQLPVIGSIHHLRGSLVHHALRDLSLRHGPLMFLKFGELPVIVASTAEAAKEVMKTNDAIFSTRPLSSQSSWLVRAMSRRAVREVEAYSQSLFAFMDGVVGQHLERRRSTEEEEEDLIDVLLRIQKEGKLQFPLTMRIIQAVIFDLVGGGIEAAATTLQWAMAELMRNPGIMAKAQAEVRGVFMGQTKVTEDRLGELGELPYLQLIIKETLRQHVPGPLLIPRECQEQRRILGYDVPKGAMVLVNAWAVARSPDYWDEPDAFHPERFLGDARDFKGNDFELIPFGAGRRMCPGMAFGLANVELGLASLFFSFDWRPPEGVVPAELDMTKTMGITARRKADLFLSAPPCVKLGAHFHRTSFSSDGS